uniref:2-oxoacid:acceptor oxidoreductase family protein n=1 Tax=Staphylococcus haemolyticus TaxID=1283 RepID=UPI00164361F3
DLEILVAFDEERIELNDDEMGEDRIIIADGKGKGRKGEECGGEVIELGFSRRGKELGSGLMKNMVGVGGRCAMMDLDSERFETVISNMFSKKGE